MQMVRKNAKRKFAFFTCSGLHFSHARRPEKMSKESSHFSLVWGHTFTCKWFGKMSTESSRFSLTGITLLTCREFKRMLALNFLLTLTTNKACLGTAYQKLKLSVHTKHKRAVARWNLTLMDRQSVDRVEQKAKPVFLVSVCLHTSTLSWFSVSQLRLALWCIPGFRWTVSLWISRVVYWSKPRLFLSAQNAVHTSAPSRLGLDYHSSVFLAIDYSHHLVL